DQAVELVDEVRNLGRGARRDLADRREAMLLVARIDALRAVAREEIAGESQARHALEYRYAHLFGAPRIDRGLVDHHRALAQHGADTLAGAHQGREIGSLVAVDRGWHRDDESPAAARLAEV